MADRYMDDVVALIPMLRAYAMSLTRSRAEADDLVQDTLVRAWRFRDAFREGTNLKAWLYKILRNAHYTSLAQRSPLVEDVDGRHAARLVSVPDQEWQLRFGELLKSLDLLTRDTRDALLLVVAAGLTYEEAAEVCGCAVGTMKSRVSRARARLAALTGYDLPTTKRQPSRPKTEPPDAYAYGT